MAVGACGGDDAAPDSGTPEDSGVDVTTPADELADAVDRQVQAL